MVTGWAEESTQSERPQMTASERALAESTERYRSLFEYNPHAAFSLDLEGRFIDANPVAQALSGYSLDELQRMEFVEMICPEDVQRTIEGFLGAVDRVPQRLEASMFHRDGHRIEMSLTAVPVVVGDEVVGVHGVAEDITESNELRRELERTRRLAEEASSTKSLFLANMSHEVRTPLTSMLGSVELLMDTEMSSEQSILANLIDRSGERLLRLVSDLLDFSRIEVGTLALSDTAVDLHGVVDEAATYAVKLARPRGLALVWNVEPGVPARVSGDALRISQVLTNLLENAIKFTEIGQVSLTVEVVRSGATEVDVRFRVEDTGIGIPEEQLSSLFHPFTQADPSATRKYGGAGLGLAICQELVTLMNGSLTVESAVGTGSTFTVLLPLRRLLD
jgi:PAS domain S-box-containing protein